VLKPVDIVLKNFNFTKPKFHLKISKPTASLKFGPEGGVRNFWFGVKFNKNPGLFGYVSNLGTRNPTIYLVLPGSVPNSAERTISTFLPRQLPDVGAMAYIGAETDHWTSGGPSNKRVCRRGPDRAKF
jgi:hypothetical protein